MVNNARRSKMSFRKANKSSDVVTKQQVQSMLRSREEATREPKNYEFAVSGTSTAAGAVGPLSQGIIPGSGQGARDGEQITAFELRTRFSASMNSAATNTDKIRLIVFSDNNNTGTLPAVTEILTSASVVAGYTNYVIMAKRFKIIFDKVFPMSIAGNSRAIYFTRDIRFNAHKISYNGDTSVSAANGKGALFVLIMDDLGSLNSTYAFQSQLFYRDG